MYKAEDLQLVRTQTLNVWPDAYTKIRRRSIAFANGSQENPSKRTSRWFWRFKAPMRRGACQLGEADADGRVEGRRSTDGSET